MESFINKLEDLYENINIYRAIILILSNNNEKVNDLYNHLLYKHHIPMIIDDDTNIDYNYRLFIINDIDLLYKFQTDSYNIIFIYK